MTRTGLSPRGRGNHVGSVHIHCFIRSIPAWAGEPSPLRRGSTSTWVYPRVGGGTVTLKRLDILLYGLSPRGRGNRGLVHHVGNPAGSIPAWAGEPAKKLSFARSTWVYPRVGGGTSATPPCPGAFQGLSPRGRGNPLGLATKEAPNRSIPAWAGEPQVWRCPSPSPGVYPRVGGGTK